ncbi:MAG: hypothetical protein ACXVJN_15075, partial [Mucilaginibacter sp.]
MSGSSKEKNIQNGKFYEKCIKSHTDSFEKFIEKHGILKNCPEMQEMPSMDIISFLDQYQCHTPHSTELDGTLRNVITKMRSLPN